MDPEILPTKLIIPPVRQTLVDRPRLLEKLNHDLITSGSRFSRKLSLISAPAGYGKSTLCAKWVKSLKKQSSIETVWLSLDKYDNNPARFFKYLVATLQTINANWGQSMLEMLHAPERPSPATLMSSLIQDICAIQTPTQVILVFDDFHFITNRIIHDAITFLLDHQPYCLHFVILTREDPMLPLARLRAKRQIVEIRMADLRFTLDETAVFLRDLKGLQLDQGDIKALEMRTEGWIVGLQLVALSMKQSDDLPKFIRSFTGSSRYLLDYLIEEIMAQQTADIQTYLLQTSILLRFNASLCDAVTQRADSDQLLPKLQHTNLFLINLDENQEWFRYHHLFAELLQHRLSIIYSDIRPLHLRAGQWFIHETLHSEAIPHFLAAEAWTEAAVAIIEVSERMLRHGEAATLLQWISQFPPNIINQNFMLSIQYIWALILTGKLDAAHSIIERLAQQAENIPPLYAQVLVAQAYLARLCHDVPRTISLSKQALAMIPAEQFSSRAVLTVNLGIAHWAAGQLDNAERVLTESRFTAEQARNFYARDTAVGFLALVQGMQGKLVQAASMLQQLLSLETSRPTMTLAHRVLGALLYEWNDLTEANKHFALAEKWALAINNVELLVGILRGWILLKQRQNNQIEATKLLSRLHALTIKHNLPPFIQAGNAAVHVKMALLQEDLATAVHWAGKVTEPADGSPFFPKLNLTPARLLFAQGETKGAMSKLNHLYDEAKQAKWVWGMIEIRALQALSAANEKEALFLLDAALSLAEPARLVRTFVDKGKPMAALLRKAVWQKVHPIYANRLLAHFQIHEETPISGTSQLEPTIEIIEPLSEREIEIIHLLARRRTNAEIAQTLIVSINTVKTHLQHIYEKLGVHDRKTAVSHARHLNILSKFDS